MRLTCLIIVAVLAAWYPASGHGHERTLDAVVCATERGEERFVLTREVTKAGEGTAAELVILLRLTREGERFWHSQTRSQAWVYPHPDWLGALVCDPARERLYVVAVDGSRISTAFVRVFQISWSNPSIVEPEVVPWSPQLSAAPWAEHDLDLPVDGVGLSAVTASLAGGDLQLTLEPREARNAEPHRLVLDAETGDLVTTSIEVE